MRQLKGDELSQNSLGTSQFMQPGSLQQRKYFAAHFASVFSF